MATGFHGILTRWRNHFSYLLNVHGVNIVRQAELRITQRTVSEQCAFEVEMATGMLKRHRSPDINQIPAEMNKAGGKTICSEIHKLVNSTWNKVKLP